MEWIKLATQAVTGLIQFNSKDRRDERRRKKLNDRLDSLASEIEAAFASSDGDTLTLLDDRLSELRKQARRSRGGGT